MDTSSMELCCHYTPKPTTPVANKSSVDTVPQGWQPTYTVLRGDAGIAHLSILHNEAQKHSMVVRLYGDIGNATIHLVSVSGNNQGELWRGTLSSSPQEITIELPAEVSSGNYILALVDSQGRRWASVPFVFAP